MLLSTVQHTIFPQLSIPRCMYIRMHINAAEGAYYVPRSVRHMMPNSPPD